jgi:hypothetical protein
MEYKSLLRSQANSVLEEIIGIELTPNEFNWEDVPGFMNWADLGKGIVSKLSHRSGYYYIFDNRAHQVYSRWSPDFEKLVSGDVNHEKWNTQLENVKRWLRYLKREIESPNFWGAISQESEIINATSSNDLNSYFTKAERAYIFSGIEEIKQYLLTAHRLDSELVESRLNYLAEASERVGRKDWINLLLSVLVGIVVSAALPPETTREIFRFVGQVLHNVLIQTPLLL